MQRLFPLDNAGDLFKKLQWEFDQFSKEPDNTYLAFNFFITAEHLPEWIFEGDSTKANDLRNKTTLLQICSHIANSAKHFKLKDRRHRSIESIDIAGGAFPKGSFPKRYFPKNYIPESRLFVRLIGQAKSDYGEYISAIELARKVLQYWQNYFAEQSK